MWSSLANRLTKRADGTAGAHVIACGAGSTHQWGSVGDEDASSAEEPVDPLAHLGGGATSCALAVAAHIGATTDAEGSTPIMWGRRVN
jgi:hypothetical protein